MPQRNHDQITFARQLRRDLTPAEKIMWKQLRNRRFASFKFRRQHPVGPYIVDFCCPSINLVIELDGETHLGREKYDEERTAYLQEKGFTILRFWNTEIYEELEVVLERIYQCCNDSCSRPLNPSPLEGERGEEVL